MLGAATFGLAIWIRAEPGFNEWIMILEIQEYYIGIYILMVSSVLIMIVAFMGCGAALMENTVGLTMVSENIFFRLHKAIFFKN